jgi:hypothetical protein
MPSPRPDTRKRAVRWLLPVSLLALLPKCALCVIAYLGLGTALGLTGSPRVELCAASPQASATWSALLAWLGATGVAGAIVLVTVRARGTTSPAAQLSCLGRSQPEGKRTGPAGSGV